MRLVFRLAWRNVWRNPRRTGLTIAATVFAVVLVVFSVAMSTGTHEKMIEDSVRLGSGHVQVAGSGYHQNQTLEQFVRYDARLASRIEQHPQVVGHTPRIQSFGLLSGNSATYGIGVLGVDPVKEASVTTLPSRIDRGRFVDGQSRNEIVLGERLAKNVGADVGDEVLLYSVAYSLESAYDLFRVVGIMRLPDASLERSLAVVSLADAQAFYVYEGRVSEIAVLVGDSEAVPSVVGAIRSGVDPESTEVHAWWETAPEMQQLIAVDDAGMYLMLAILIIVVGFGILNTILMAVLERKREFGVVLALGLHPVAVFRIVYLESMLLACVGLLLGLAISVPLCAWLEGHPVALGGDAVEAMALFGIEPVMTWKLRAANPIGSTLTVLAVAFLAALYPALKASRGRPVDVLRSL
jgi:ABC-type lipoprotein release transport system permease subunit